MLLEKDSLLLERMLTTKKMQNCKIELNKKTQQNPAPCTRESR